MKLRRLHSSDIENLAAPLSDLGAVTFADTFGHLYTPEDLAYFIENSHSADVYAKVLAASDQPIWVIEDNDKLVAYIKLGPNGLPCAPPMPNAIEISKFYALAEYRSMGLGAQLMEAAVTYARAEGFKDMVLSVYSENFGGHKFYKRHGFEKIGEYLFPVGKQLDQEWIMHKRL